MSIVEVRSLEELVSLRDHCDLTRVILYTREFKYRNLLPQLFRYGLWALAPGGELLIRDAGRSAVHRLPYEIGFNQVSAIAARYLARDAERFETDLSGSFGYRRTSPMTPAGWSAGIMFSGAVAELPLLERCVAGLRAQPELTGPTGEIAICGPAAAAAAAARFGARYLAYDSGSARFMIGAKKTFLIESLTKPRIIILHARIVLDAGTLARFPREFDIVTPRVELDLGRRAVPYLDFNIVDYGDGTDVAGLTGAPLHYPRRRYLEYLRYGIPYIDGGVFAVRRDAYRNIPLHACLAWGEQEDLEWSQRARALGFLVDLAPDARAVSQTSKLRRPLFPAEMIDSAGRTALRAARNLAGFARLKLGLAR